MQDKTTLVLTLFTIGILTPLGADAAPLGTWYDPIHVQIEQTPTNSLLQQQGVIRGKEEALKDQYGLSNYYSCVRSTGYLDKSGGPSAGIYLSAVQYCLERIQLQKEREEQECQAGYLRKNGKCVTPDAGCKLTYGPNSIFRSFDATGAPLCDCQSGYAWSANGTSCVIQGNNNDAIQQARRDSLGGIGCTNGWEWSKTAMACVPPKDTTECNGKYWTACSAGQEFYCPSSGDAQCLIKDAEELGKESFPDLCKKSYGSHSIWTGEKNDDGGPICGCTSGYEFNISSTVCTKVQKQSAQEATPNNFLIPKLTDGPSIATDTPRRETERGFFTRLMQILNPFSWF